MAWQVGRQDVPPRVAQERFRQRLLALSRTHNLLNEIHWERASLRTIRETALAPYMTPLSRVKIDGLPVNLPAWVAVVLGMAFHELVTNAAKLGALSSERGRLQVDWKIVRSEDETVLTVDWCDLDGPSLEVEPNPGFGSRLLRRTITRELAGKLDRRFEREGVCCTMTIPIEAAAHQAA